MHTKALAAITIALVVVTVRSTLFAQVEALDGIDMATDKKITEDPRFNFEKFKSLKGVIPFKNGYGINLSGARIQDGEVVGSTMLDAYKTKDGRELPGRLIRQVERDGKLVLEETIIRSVSSDALPKTKAAARSGSGIQDAASRGDTTMVMQLVQNDKKLVDSKDAAGWTPLHYAANKGRKDAVEILLANGADINAQSDDGWTPLHLAAGGGYRQVVELLLSKGGNPQTQDKYGKMPIDLAKRERHNDIVSLLGSLSTTTSGHAPNGSHTNAGAIRPIEGPANERLRDAFFKGTITDSTTGEKFKIFGGGIAATAGGKTAVLYIIGIPFHPPKSLTVEGELLVNNSITIKLVGYDKAKNLLLPTEDSPIPQGEPDWSKGQMGIWFTHAANVTWEFTKAGISFDTDDATYVSTKDGAQIIFTKQEVRMDGVEKLPKTK